MNTEKSYDKPLILEMRDAKLDIINCINNHHKLPAYILCVIVEEVLTSLKDIERQEIELAEKQYAQTISESEKI